jgi:hypothetical protein
MQMIVGLDIWSRLKNSDWAKEAAPLLRFDKKYANQPLHRSPLRSAGELFIGVLSWEIVVLLGSLVPYLHSDPFHF